MSSAPDEAAERTPDEDSSTVQSISVLEPSVRRESSSQISTPAYFDTFSSQRPYSQEQWYNNQTYNDPFYGQPSEYFVPSTQHYLPQQVSILRNHGVPPAVPSIAAPQYHSTPNGFDHSLFQKVKGSDQTVDPPPNYVCHKCKFPGHWIRNCPITVVPDVKKSSGIPQSFMTPVDPSSQGALMTPSGKFAVPIMDMFGSSYEESSEVPFSNYLNYSVTPYWYLPAQSFSHASATTAASSADTDFDLDHWNSYHASLPNDLEMTETPASLGQSKIISDDKNTEPSLPNACLLESKQTLEPTRRSGSSSRSSSRSNRSEKDDFYASPVYDYRMEMLKDNICPSKNVKQKSNNLSRYPEKLCVIIQNCAKSSSNHDKRSDGGSSGSSAEFFTTMNDQHSDIHDPRIGLSKEKCVENTPNRSDKREDEDKYQKETLKSDHVAAKEKKKKLDMPTLREKQVQQKLARVLTSLRTLYGRERRELLIQKIELNLELNRILSSKRNNTWYGIGKKRKKNVRKDLQEVYHFLKTSSNIKERLRLKYIERELIHEFCSQSNPLSLDEDNRKIGPYHTKQQANEESIPASKKQRLSSCESSHESPALIPECANDEREETSKAKPCAKNCSKSCEPSHESPTLIPECTNDEHEETSNAKPCAKDSETPSAEKEISHGESMLTTEKKTTEDCQPSHESPTVSPKPTKKRKLKAGSIKGQKNKEAKVLRKESGSEKERQEKLSQQNEEQTTRTKKKKSLEDEVIGASNAQPTTKTKKKKSLEDEVIRASSAQPTTKTKKKKSLENEIIGASSARRNTTHVSNEFYKYIGESLSALSNMKKILTNHERLLLRNIGDQSEERPSSRESFQQSNSKEDIMRQDSGPLPQEHVPSNQLQLDKCEENKEYLPPRRKAVRKDLREIIEARKKKFGPRKKMVDDGKKWTSFWKRREEVEAKQTEYDALSEQVDDCVLVPPVIPEVDLVDCETSEEDTTTNENNIPMKPIWAIKIESESSEDESSKNVEVSTIPTSQTVPTTEDESLSQANTLRTDESRFFPVEMLELESLQDTEISTRLEEERNDTVEREARTTTLNKHHESTTIVVSNPEIVLPAENEFHSRISTLSNEGSGSLSVKMLEMECLPDTEILSRLEEECHDTAEKEERTTALDKDHQDTTIAVSNTEILLPTEDEFHSQISTLSSEESGSLSVEVLELECSQDIEVHTDLEEQLGNTKENEVGTIALNDKDMHSTIQVVDSGPEEGQFLSQVCVVNVEEETQSNGPVSQSSLINICPDILVNNSQEMKKHTEMFDTATLDIASTSSGSNENSAANKKIGMINIKSIEVLIADDGKEYVDVQFCDENSKRKCVVKADGKYDHNGFTNDEVNLTSMSYHDIPATNGCEVNINDVSKNYDGIASSSRARVQNTAADESDVQK